MNVNDPKNLKLIGAVAALLLIGTAWYLLLYSKYNDKISQKAQEFETITTNLRNVETKAKSLDALRVEYDELLKRYEEIETLLPEVKQIPSMLVQLHTASSLSGTRITKVQPIPVREQEFYNIAAFDIEMTGTYHDFGSFVSYVANFPFIANLSNVNVKAQKVAVKKSSQEEPQDGEAIREVGRKQESVTVSFTLSTYFVKEGEQLTELSL